MIIKVKVKPGSKKQEIIKKGEEYEIRLREKTEKNKANIELINLLKRYFKVPATKIKIKNKKSREKIVEIIKNI